MGKCLKSQMFLEILGSSMDMENPYLTDNLGGEGVSSARPQPIESEPRSSGVFQTGLGQFDQ